MKKLDILVVTGLLACSCNKSSSPDPNPAPDITDSVTSFTIYTPGNPNLNKDTFRFDISNRILSISFLDLGGTPPGQTVDSGSFYFTFGSSAWQPIGYNLIARKSIYINDITEVHTLTYDGENKLVLDSMTSVSAIGYTPKGAHYDYFTNGVAIRTYQQGDADYSRLDSIFIVNGNFSHFSDYYLNGSAWALSYSYGMTINTNYENPYYSENLSKSLGAFMIFTCSIDFLSKNLTYDASLPSFIWTTDIKGRISLGSASNGSYIKYTYK